MVLRAGLLIADTVGSASIAVAKLASVLALEIPS